MTIDDATKKLQLALRRLEEPQGYIARRNARSAVASALRAVRAAVDETFPSTTPRRARYVISDPVRRENAIQARLRRDGYIPIGEAGRHASDLLPLLASAGVRVVGRKRRVGQLVTWVPSWVKDFHTVADLKRARTDIRFRNAKQAVQAAVREVQP